MGRDLKAVADPGARGNMPVKKIDPVFGLKSGEQRLDWLRLHRHRQRCRFVTVAQQPIEERRKIGDSALKVQNRDVVVVKEAPLNFRLADDGGGTASVEALQIGEDMFVV